MTAESQGFRRRDGRVPPTVSPQRVNLPVNIHHWDNISFLHWPFEPNDLAPLLPRGLSVLTYDEAAWVGVTPFFIRVRPPVLPVVPPGWSFPETNVRTYVAGPDGREGLWFFHMEVTALWFVAILRIIGLPYFQQRMSVEAGGNRIVYKSKSHRSSPDGGHHIVVRPGEALDPPAGGPRERFLTARWGAYHRRGPVLLYTPVEHPPWRLRAAAVERCEVDALFCNAGLRAPVGQPIAHFSPGVSVKVGRPQVASW
jgi:uncharacterized protein YqjF (DUF2071 family)